MVRRNNWINLGIIFTCITAGLLGILRESQGWWLLSIILLGVSVIFEWIRYRCPHCHKKIHWLYYRAGKCCPHCGGELDEEEKP